MLPKPPACRACPLYGDGKGFVPDDPREGATVAILAQNPGANEERGEEIVGYAGPRNPIVEHTSPKPLIGATGYLLTHTFLPLAQLTREQVSFHNVLKCRWNHTNHLPDGATYNEAVKICTEAHLRLPDSVTTIVCQGAAAWRVTQGSDYPITQWRGYLGPSRYRGHACYGTIHIADLLRDPHGRFIARFDWKRLRRYLDGLWPTATPPQCAASPARRGDFVRLLDEALQQPEIMVDTEYVVDKQLLTHIGAAWRVGDTVRGFQLEWIHGAATSVERAVFMRYWPRLCRQVRMGFWNAKADLPILQANLHDQPDHIEDPMQAHAVLWPDLDHDLEFVASIYGQYAKMKHLSGQDILAYHWGDCLELLAVWDHLKQELANDPLAERKYREQNLKLIPILLDTEAHGIAINQVRLQEARPVYEALAADAQLLAEAYTGYPINIGSAHQLISYLSCCEGYTRLRSVDQDVVSTLRAKYADFDADEEAKHGLTHDYICSRVEQGAHGLLEARVMYATNQQIISHYLTPLSGVTRCYPQINIHTQAGGRHSTTRPPLATLPNALRTLLLPDPGDVWIGWDWDQQEPRIQAAESGSRVLRKAFDEGEDIHTTFVCRLYGWPLPHDLKDPHGSAVDVDWRRDHGWMGKDDPRRVFAKTTRYEINYGGDGSQAAKKAIRLGVDPAIAKQAAQVLLQSDPELAAWFRRLEQEVVQTHIVRSWDGGRRVFYWVDPRSPSAVAEMQRQARNFPPQGGGAGLYNLTMVEIVAMVPQVQFVWGAHDSQYWRVRETEWRAVFPMIKRIATQPRLINNRLTSFPASFKLYTSDGKVEKVVE